ncbi:MAG TPA: flavodoxin-dependent (E)-4-hydroxy-3-methylbut-2-enyl-diphosphate synthase [Candidatus Saccharicenans sp.]|nr:flavodoxin-dependent (E)-4-hydroxy-3-methylbut-2-enyl-diphosphate synthase [Candidatus Saccharicenans sp.]
MSEALFPRRKTKVVRIGQVEIGGGRPIVVQSMTKTRTARIEPTVRQIKRLEKAGCQLVRLAVPEMADALAIKEIKKRVSLPLVADIHFDPRLAIASIEAGVDGLRINPGTFGSKSKLKEVVERAGERKIPIRIGINSGSLEKDLRSKYGEVTPEAMVESALREIKLLEDLGFYDIKISLKASDIQRTLRAYQLLARRVDYPFHAGITEAGTMFRGSLKSVAGLSLLIREGLADTIRVSLTAPPEKEVEVANLLLQDLGLKKTGINFISCPGCGRSQVDIQKLATQVEKRISAIKSSITVAVMGCPVNGPGEAKEADLGVAGGQGTGIIFKKGKVVKKVPADKIVDELVKEVFKLLDENREAEEGNNHD